MSIQVMRALYYLSQSYSQSCSLPAQGSKFPGGTPKQISSIRVTTNPKTSFQNLFCYSLQPNQSSFTTRFSRNTRSFNCHFRITEYTSRLKAFCPSGFRGMEFAY